MKFSRIFFICFLMHGFLFAQTDTTQNDDKLYQATVDEILNISVQDKKIEISSSSGTAESLAEVPSSVTVFTRKQIQDMGIEDVYDLLNYVPGFQATRNIATFEYQEIHVRGQNADNKLLFLINGQRLNEGYAARASLFNRYISTSNIKQIEIIRGPGSTLFGSNAFLGVVNIITDNESNELVFRLGSQQSANATVNFSQSVSNDFFVSASANFYQDAGQSFDITNQLTQNVTSTQDPRDNQTFYTNLRYKDFTFNGSYARNNSDDFFGYTQIGNQINQNTTVHWHGDLNYDTDFNERVNFNTTISYSRYLWDAVGLNLSGNSSPQTSIYDFIVGPYLNTNDFQIASNLNFKINEKHNLITGVSYRNTGVSNFEGYTNHVSPDGTFSAPITSFYIGEIKRFDNVGQLNSVEKSVGILGIYAQYKAKIGKNLITFAGIRYDNYFDISSTLNPRLGLVYQTNFGATFKGLYGTAFRAPVINEIYINTPFDAPNPDLKPERIATYEFIYLQKFKKVNIELVLFHNITTDAVITGQSSDERQISLNQDSTINTTGLEMSANATILKNMFAQVSYTYYFDGFSQNTFGNFLTFALNYQKKKWNFNINAVYRPALEKVLLEQDSYLLMNLKARYQLNRKFGLNFSALNLFDTAYLTRAETLTQFNQAIPNRGLQWRFGLEFRFNK